MENRASRVCEAGQEAARCGDGKLPSLAAAVSEIRSQIDELEKCSSGLHERLGIQQPVPPAVRNEAKAAIDPDEIGTPRVDRAIIAVVDLSERLESLNSDFQLSIRHIAKIELESF